MDSQGWHERFLTQSRWTFQLRQFLYHQTGLEGKTRILEVGCGTGVIAQELSEKISMPAIGIDLDFQRLQFARNKDAFSYFANADGYHLPFANETFDFVFTHYLFLWLIHPIECATEIKRVLRKGGTLVALAEPDYLARVDYPQELWKLGEMQTKALIKQGANPMMGRKLPELFSEAGFQNIQFGLSGFQSQPQIMPDWLDSEWAITRHDLADTATTEELLNFQQLDHISRIKGARVLWVPTFYASGIRVY